MSFTILADTKIVGHSLLVIETAAKRYEMNTPIYASKMIDATACILARQPEDALLGKYVGALFGLQAAAETAIQNDLVAAAAILLRALHMWHGQPAALVISAVERNDDLHMCCWTKSFDHLPKSKRIKAARKEIEQNFVVTEAA